MEAELGFQGPWGDQHQPLRENPSLILQSHTSHGRRGNSWAEWEMAEAGSAWRYEMNKLAESSEVRGY